MDVIATDKPGTGNMLDDILKSFILALEFRMKFGVPEAVKNFEKQHALTGHLVFPSYLGTK